MWSKLVLKMAVQLSNRNKDHLEKIEALKLLHKKEN